MPSPKKYKSKKQFMKDCMHTTVHEEGKSRDQGVAQCLNMWRQEKKKMADVVASNFTASIIRDKIQSLIEMVTPKVQGLSKPPSKEKSLELVKSLPREKFEKIVNILKGFTNTSVTAWDLESILKTLKGLADIKTVLAIIVLMGVFNTTEASTLYSKVQDTAQNQIDVKNDIKLISYNSFSLMGKTRVDIRIIDDRGEIQESKGFMNDQEGAQKYLEALKKSYPKAKVTVDKRADLKLARYVVEGFIKNNLEE